MSTFKFSEANLGFFGYTQLANYVVSQRGDTSTTLDWNTGLGALDPTHFAAHVTLTYSGYASYQVEDGVDAGQTRVTAGLLTEVAFTDAGGALLLDISNLSVRLPIFMAQLQQGNAFAAWQLLSHSGATFVGSSSAAGPGHAGTGDVIETTAGNDTVTALGGDDFVRDHGGADAYFGGSGFDTLAYDGWNLTPWLVTQGLTVNLLLGTIRGPDGQLDTVAGFEAITGTFMNDTMRGNAGANKFEGGAGADYFDGRGGRDTVSYADDAGMGGTDGIRVNLAAATVRDGFGFVDKIYNVEIIIGTAVRDTFFDNGADNSFDGGAGNDTLHFSGGDDLGHGGAGADTFVFDGTFGDDVVDDFSLAEGDHIRISGAVKFSDLQLSDILTDDGPAALITFGNNTVTLTGVAAASLHAADFGL